MSRYRKPLHRLKLAVAVTACWVVPACWLAPRASATTYVAMSDAALFDGSPAVVLGRVVALESVPVNAVPAVDYYVDVEETLKGAPQPGERVTVRVPGGVRPDGIALKIWGAPRFAPGEEVLLFLEPAAHGTFALHQFLLGAFHLAHRDGEKIAWRHLEEAHEVRLKGQPPNPRGRRHAERFGHWLEDRGSGLERLPDYFLPEEEHASEGTVAPPGTPPKFALVTSSTEPPPLGCGSDGGHPVRWFTHRTPWPVTWRYHADGQPGLEAGGLNEFLAALLAWGDDPNTPIRYLHIGSTRLTNGFQRQDGVNSIVFGDPNDEIGGNFASTGVLAVGGPWFSCELERYSGEDFHPIVEADIVVQDGVSAFFETFDDPSHAVRELFAHELGHTLGLAHSLRPDALMRALIHADGRGAALDRDDLAAAYHLYGRPGFPVDTDGSTDVTPRVPEPPVGLTAGVEGFDRVRLTWTDTSLTESNFRVERRRRGDPNYELAGTSPAGRNEFLDTVEPEGAYTYRVLAQNGTGRSAPTRPVYVEMPEDLRPDAPASLWAAPTSDSTVRLSWEDVSDDEDGFVIELLTDEGFKPSPIQAPANTTAVDVQGLRPAETFTFRVRAMNDFGPSAATAPAPATTFGDAVACRAQGRLLCLGAGRFSVGVELVSVQGTARPATAVPLTGRSGVFRFFRAGNPEVAVRLVDDPHQDTLRLVLAGLSNLEYRVEILDSVTGKLARYHHPPGETCIPESRRVFHFPRIPLKDASPTRFAEASYAAEVASERTSAPGALAQYLPPLIPRGGQCEHDAWTLCLLDGRFSVELQRTDMAEQLPALARGGDGESGFFSFSDPRQPDVVFKLLDARVINGRAWVFSSPPLAGGAYRITVTDTASGRRRSYDSEAASGCAVADTLFFALE